MKPSPEYVRKILNVFEDSTDPVVDILQFQALGIPYETAEFYFHMRLLNDQGFVERDDGEPGIGVDRSADGSICWSALPLRLTSSGQTFAEAMHHHAGFEAVKKSLVTSSLSIMRDIAVAAFRAQLAKHGIQS